MSRLKGNYYLELLKPKSENSVSCFEALAVWNQMLPVYGKEMQSWDRGHSEGLPMCVQCLFPDSSGTGVLEVFLFFPAATSSFPSPCFWTWLHTEGSVLQPLVQLAKSEIFEKTGVLLWFFFQRDIEIFFVFLMKINYPNWKDKVGKWIFGMSQEECFSWHFPPPRLILGLKDIVFLSWTALIRQSYFDYWRGFALVCWWIIIRHIHMKGCLSSRKNWSFLIIKCPSFLNLLVPLQLQW